MSGARWFVRGDLDGFFGLALDNLIQLLLIVWFCGGLLGFPPELLFGTVLPAAALSLLAGNWFYSRQAMQLARAEGRDDVCALPYGINTVSLIAYVFLVMLPVRGAVLGSLTTLDQATALARDLGLTVPAGESLPALAGRCAAYVAWRAGVVACLGSGLIEFAGSFGVDWLRRYVPRAALLSTLAGIALTFIAFEFLFRTYAAPVIGLTTFTIVCLVYFGGLRFKGGVPGGLVAVVVGVALCWLTGVAPTGTLAGATASLGLRLPVPVIGDLFAGAEYMVDYLPVIIPMGLFSVFGSLQNLESAEAAGDRYPTRPSLMANGLGTLVAAVFGSCFPTTIYIGHPGWKQLGARIGYSWLNGAFMTVVCFTGLFGLLAWAVPIEAGMAIVLWIAIVITAQAFQETPRTHAPAVVIGLLPGVVALAALMLKQGVRAGALFWAGRDEALGALVPPAPAQSFTPALGEVFRNPPLRVYAEGAFAMEQGIIFTAMLFSAAAVAIIERRFRLAAGWFWAAAVLSFVGLMHGWQYTGGDTAMSLDFWHNVTAMAPNVQAALGYALAGILCFVAPYLGTVSAYDGDAGPAEDAHDQQPPPGG